MLIFIENIKLFLFKKIKKKKKKKKNKKKKKKNIKIFYFSK